MSDWQRVNDQFRETNQERAARQKPAEYEAPRNLAENLRVRGVGRTADEPRALLVLLTERPTDDEIRSLHEFLRGWRAP